MPTPKNISQLIALPCLVPYLKVQLFVFQKATQELTSLYKQCAIH
jgi:hypothetical protein